MGRRKGVLFFVLALILVLDINTVKASNLSNYVSNIKLEGNAKGIVFIPGEEPFLYGPNMLPGDKIQRSISIDSKYNVPYELYMRAERVTAKEKYDLLQKIKLKITYHGEKIYEGPVSGEDGLLKNIDLGKVNPKESKYLNAEVVLDGSTTGNEYKNKFGEVNWIFTAVNTSVEDDDKNPPENNGGDNPFEYRENNIVDKLKKLPKTGEDIVLLYISLGVVSSVVGVILFKKGGKHIEKKNH